MQRKFATSAKDDIQMIIKMTMLRTYQMKNTN